MARRPSIVKKAKAKPIKLGKMAVAAMNLKHLGGEPSRNDIKGWSWTEAYTWYNYNCDMGQAKAFLVDYLANTNHPDAKAISKIDDRVIFGFGSTVCWMARMASNGYSLKDERKEYFDTRLAYLMDKASTIILEKEESRETAFAKPVSTIDKSYEKYIEVYNFFEDCFNDENYLSPYSHFSTVEANRDVIQRIYNRYTPYLRELEELLGDNPDPQLIEYYSNYKVSKVNKELAYVKLIISDCDRFLTNKKAARKPRQKKSVPVETKLKSLNYQKNDLTMNLVSFNPAKIFDAKEIWTYNTKYHIMTVYRTDTSFDIKGTTILNINEATSASKRVGSRNGAKCVGEVLSSGKVVLRTLMEKFKGPNQVVKGRIGDNTILLKYTT